MKLFQDVLEIAPEKIKVIRNASKADILKIFSELNKEARTNKQNQEDSAYSVKSFFLSWIGFTLSDHYNDYLEEYDIAKQFPELWQLTVSGEPINISQQMLKVSRNPNTITLLLVDDQ